MTTTTTVGYTGKVDGRFPAFMGLINRQRGISKHGARYTENLEGMSIDEALAAANMDYDVQITSDLTVTHYSPTEPDGVTVTFPGHHGTVRVDQDGTIHPFGFGVVGGKYKSPAPRQVFEGIGQAILDELDAKVVALGEYGKVTGARNYVAFKLPTTIEIAGVADPYDMYLTLLNSYDRSGSLRGVLAPIRLDCTNQTHATFEGAPISFSLRHTGDIVGRAEQAREIMGIKNNWVDAFRSHFKPLTYTKVSNNKFENLVRKHLILPPTTKSKRSETTYAAKIDTLNDLFRNAATNEVGRGTAYAAVNAVTEWADFYAPAHSEEGRYQRTLSGQMDGLKQRAFEVFAAV